MRKLWTVLLAGALAVSVAGVSQATTLAYDGTLSLELGTLPGIITNGSGVVTVNGSLPGGHVNILTYGTGITATTTVIVPITDPDVTGAGIVSLRATAVTLQPATLTGISAGPPLGVLDTMAISGTVLVCILMKGCKFNLPVPLTINGTRGLGLGGGLITVSGFAQTGLRLSIQGNPWTIGTASILIPTANGGTSTSTRKGFAHGAGSGTSSTAAASGVIQLVTPVIVNTNLAGNEVLALFGTLTLHFVPEPGTLLLLGSGVAGLALLGRRRMQK